MKRLLLTGIGGSVGIHTFIHVMHNTDWHVVGIDSFRHKGLNDRISEVLKDHPDWKTRLTIVTHDLASPISLMTQDRIGHVDYIVSMASLSDVWISIEDPVPVITNNVAVAVNMLEFARKAKPDAFIQISTDEVYGPSGRDQQHPEWSAILPSNAYSASKASQEAIAIAYWRSYDVPVVITNTMNNFGEMQQSNKYPVIVQNKVSRGETVTVHGEPGNIGTRYYLHSRNHADAILWILRNTTPTLHQEGRLDRPDRYNVCGDVQLDNWELASVIADIMGEKLEYRFVGASESRPGHDDHYGLDGTKLRELGWEPPVSFEDSLAETIKWQQEHPEWMNV